LRRQATVRAISVAMQINTTMRKTIVISAMFFYVMWKISG